MDRSCRGNEANFINFWLALNYQKNILDLSKLHMLKFHYDYIKEKHGNKAKLCLAGTDSLTYHIQTEDIYKEMKEDGDLFDFSDYNLDGYRSQDNTNKKVL